MWPQLTPLVVMLVVTQQTEAANARATQDAKIDAKRTQFNVYNDIITVREAGAAGATVVLSLSLSHSHNRTATSGPCAGRCALACSVHLLTVTAA